ncbi:metallophosphoesterase family protein, partial [Halolamina salina]|uniref:metallophosphoesterase family protein n=1 Tax=Halolamina salina TaxID=1220023 RepID=UPI00360E9659
MLVVLSDTHRTEGTGLVGAAEDAVADADLVLHAGDFTTEAVLDAFHDAATDLRAVYGNRDDAAVTDRRPE